MKNEKLDSLREDIRQGLEQLDKGESVPLDAERIKAEGRRRMISLKNSGGGALSR